MFEYAKKERKKEIANTLTPHTCNPCVAHLSEQAVGISPDLLIINFICLSFCDSHAYIMLWDWNSPMNLLSDNLFFLQNVVSLHARYKLDSYSSMDILYLPSYHL